MKFYGRNHRFKFISLHRLGIYKAISLSLDFIIGWWRLLFCKLPKSKFRSLLRKETNQYYETLMWLKQTHTNIRFLEDIMHMIRGNKRQFNPLCHSFDYMLSWHSLEMSFWVRNSIWQDYVRLKSWVMGTMMLHRIMYLSRW